MKNATRFGKLIRDMSRDPRFKKAVAQARKRSRGTDVARLEDATGVFVLTTKIASLFFKKKKARAIEDAMDLTYLLVQVSILLKENIFDRPEVRKFFNESLRRIYSAAEEFVGMILPKVKAKGARPTRAVRRA